MSQTGIAFGGPGGATKNLLGKNLVEQSMASRDREYDSLTGDSVLSSSAIQSKGIDHNRNIRIQGNPKTFKKSSI